MQLGDDKVRIAFREWKAFTEMRVLFQYDNLEASPAANCTNGSAQLVVLLHGYPEIAYSFRKQMGPFAAAGYHSIAPDHRCVGRTTGCNTSYDASAGYGCRSARTTAEGKRRAQHAVDTLLAAVVLQCVQVARARREGEWRQRFGLGTIACLRARARVQI